MGFQSELATARMPGIRVVDSVTRQTAFRIAHGAAIQSASISSDGKYVRTVGGGTSLTWRGPLFNQVLSLTHASEVWGLDFSKDGRFLAVATANVRIWSIPDGK